MSKFDEFIGKFPRNDLTIEQIALVSFGFENGYNQGWMDSDSAFRQAPYAPTMNKHEH
jgi:hypothetical protein